MRFQLTVLATFFLLGGCVSAPPEDVTDQDPRTTLDNLTKRIQPDLAKLGDAADERGLEVSQVVITLNTTVIDEENGSFGILVFQAGQGKKVTDTSQFTITFEQPPDLDVQKSLRTTDFFAALQDIVVNADNSLGSLTTSSVVGELKFVLVQTASGGVDLDVGEFDIAPITIEMSGKTSTSYTHSIKVVLKRPKPPADKD